MAIVANPAVITSHPSVIWTSTHGGCVIICGVWPTASVSFALMSYFQATFLHRYVRGQFMGGSAMGKRHGTKAWFQCGDQRPGGVLQSRTARVRPRRMTAILRRHRPSMSTVLANVMAPEARSA
ncbi:hypothetical protein THAOC_24466 [Thalassiosira oceanica]|uniref:Uncharacterized protein n=1 Tax=Thalassiosira oceanica TaxID=159749 RepID=K0RRY0_THAOC|nr:hypothetical protein THAOC_24466 [Thalassiosira oceanica]|eukprot:EJK55765.1 hypothetical protein THAOC_24466 [Thalassiosira oceanica]